MPRKVLQYCPTGGNEILSRNILLGRVLSRSTLDKILDNRTPLIFQNIHSYLVFSTPCGQKIARIWYWPKVEKRANSQKNYFKSRNSNGESLNSISEVRTWIFLFFKIRWPAVADRQVTDHDIEKNFICQCIHLVGNVDRSARPVGEF